MNQCFQSALIGVNRRLFFSILPGWRRGGRTLECMAETTYRYLRDNLAGVLDKVVDDREVIIVRRKGGRDVALAPADELAGLSETAHLLRSPANARRLISALRGKGKRLSIA